MQRLEIASLITSKLQQNSTSLQEFYKNSGSIPYFFIDDLLPEKLVLDSYSQFPNKEEMILKKSLKENKYISAQMDKHSPLLEEILFAFQDPSVMKEIEKITKTEGVLADEKLYAGGLSRMDKDQFLLPHLDNSHDKNRENYRVLNLLFYISPDWKKSNGGNLELWPNGLQQEPIEIVSKFNRLAVMATHNHSLHSVNKVKVNQARCCISNYYFHSQSPDQKEYFHVTSFYNRNNRFTNALFQLDRMGRNWIKKIVPKKLSTNSHYYKKSSK